MKIRLKLRSLAAAFALLVMGCSSDESQLKAPVDYVNPYMGNISHLLVPTFPTIHLPNSMLRVYPERKDYTGDLLNGLPLVVTSHRGSSAFNLSPYQGAPAGIEPVLQYSYDKERITPYSYHVYLDEHQIEVDYALSSQSGMYELRFEKDRDVYLAVNSRNGSLAWNGEAVSGYQVIENDTRVYIYLKPEQAPENVYVISGNGIVEGNRKSGQNAALALQFARDTDVVRVRYGISFIDEEQAAKNLHRELDAENIESLQATGRRIWNEALGKIEVKGGNSEDLHVFYTSLYRCYERPVCISEDGRYYSAFDGKVHESERPFYTDDWIWDSYRAHHPLRILIDPEKEKDILNSFVWMAEQMDNFWMPTFPEITGDSRRMNSNHAVASVIDAHQKGLGGFDLKKAYEACKAGITEKTLAPWSGKPAGRLDEFYKKNGYIPALREGEEETIPEVHHFEKRQPVAVTLGTAYDEWCLSQIAKSLEISEDYEYFLKRSYNYRNLFNPETKFFHPKDAKGEFIQPFDYVFSGGLGARNYYGENNAWIYRWDVQHNIADLVNLMGGPGDFIQNLDAMFSEPLGKGKYHFYAQLPDHTGNVGQFSMANEPSLHIPYLYNYAGQPWKTQKRIRTLLKQWFRNDLMGVPGDEDGGGMSAFVVFSQLGFYPVTPGIAAYSIGSPVFEKATVNLDNGKQFRITTTNYSEENKYIQSAKLNGQEWNKPWFSHSDLASGGELILEMGDKPNKLWGSLPENAPPSQGFFEALAEGI